MTEFVSTHRPGGGRVFGFPLEGFGTLTSLLLSFASGFFCFFASISISIFSLLGWNVLGHHSVNYADSYLFVGFPAGVLVLLIALPVFGTLWVRATLRRAGSGGNRSNEASFKR